MMANLSIIILINVVRTNATENIPLEMIDHEWWASLQDMLSNNRINELLPEIISIGYFDSIRI